MQQARPHAESERADTRKHVIIVGGGFGGLRTAKELKNAPYRITLIDKENHHLFQPLLYQVATSSLTAEEIATPIRSVLRGQKNLTVRLGEVTKADLATRRITLKDGIHLDFDYLVVAAGAQTNYHGHDDWRPFMVGLKDLGDAFAIRRRVLLAFEAAERSQDEDERRRLLTFAVVGGGPTGVELAGALSELSRVVLRRDFRTVTPDMMRVVLVEMGPRLLAPFEPSLSANAQTELRRLGVDVVLGASVTRVSAEGLQLGSELIAASFICWAAGVSSVPLAAALGVACTPRGQVMVHEDCSVPGYPNVFCIGDMAAFTPPGSAVPLPGVAPVAMQQAASVASNLKNDANGKPRRPFKYLDKGMMATIGTSRAVLQYGSFRMTGTLAWLAWIAVHVYYIIGFRNRTLVMFEWAWAYVTRRRGARLITEATPPAQSTLLSAARPIYASAKALPMAPSGLAAKADVEPVTEP